MRPSLSLLTLAPYTAIGLSILLVQVASPSTAMSTVQLIALLALALSAMRLSTTIGLRALRLAVQASAYALSLTASAYVALVGLGAVSPGLGAVKTLVAVTWLLLGAHLAAWSACPLLAGARRRSLRLTLAGVLIAVAGASCIASSLAVLLFTELPRPGLGDMTALSGLLVAVLAPLGVRVALGGLGLRPTRPCRLLVVAAVLLASLTLVAVVVEAHVSRALTSYTAALMEGLDKPARITVSFTLRGLEGIPLHNLANPPLSVSHGTIAAGTAAYAVLDLGLGSVASLPGLLVELARGGWARLDVAVAGLPEAMGLALSTPSGSVVLEASPTYNTSHVAVLPGGELRVKAFNSSVLAHRLIAVGERGEDYVVVQGPEGPLRVVRVAERLGELGVEERPASSSIYVPGLGLASAQYVVTIPGSLLEEARGRRLTVVLELRAERGRGGVSVVLGVPEQAGGLPWPPSSGLNLVVMGVARVTAAKGTVIRLAFPLDVLESPGSGEDRRLTVAVNGLSLIGAYLAVEGAEASYALSVEGEVLGEGEELAVPVEASRVIVAASIVAAPWAGRREAKVVRAELEGEGDWRLIPLGEPRTGRTLVVLNCTGDEGALVKVYSLGFTEEQLDAGEAGLVALIAHEVDGYIQVYVNETSSAGWRMTRLLVCYDLNETPIVAYSPYTDPDYLASTLSGISVYYTVTSSVRGLRELSSPVYEAVVDGKLMVKHEGGELNTTILRLPGRSAMGTVTFKLWLASPDGRETTLVVRLSYLALIIPPSMLSTLRPPIPLQPGRTTTRR